MVSRRRCTTFFVIITCTYYYYYYYYYYCTEVCSVVYRLYEIDRPYTLMFMSGETRSRPSFLTPLYRTMVLEGQRCKYPGE